MEKFVKTKVLNLMLASFVILFSLMVSAKGTALQDTQISKHIENIKLRLALTEEQEQQVIPILESSVKQRQSILQNFGIDIDTMESERGNLSRKERFRKARKLKNEMDAIRNTTIAALKSVLTDEQLTEYKKIQEEMSSEIRDRVMSGR